MEIYDYWLKTFDTFLAAVEAATDEGERANINTLGLLTSFLYHRTYEIIADAPNYDLARTTLRNARHLLMSRTQNSSESIGEYVHSLKQLARDCNFQNNERRFYQRHKFDEYSTATIRRSYLSGSDTEG